MVMLYGYVYFISYGLNKLYTIAYFNYSSEP